jgi:CHAT domain-containing protein/tetratricopeptide (TPR) repeat protein
VKEILDRAAQLTQSADVLAATDRAIKMAEQSSDHEGLALACRLRARTVANADAPAEALAMWRRAADEFEKAGDVLGQIESLSTAGTLLLKSDSAEAERLFNKALAAGNPEETPSIDVARAYITAGDAITETGTFGRAKKFYEAALSICKRIAPDSLDMAEAYEGLGRVLLDARQDLATTLQYFESGLRIGEKLAPDSALVARLHVRVGNVYAMRSEFPSAIQHFQLSIKLYESMGPHAHDEALAGCLNGLGIIAARTGNYFDARTYFERALKIKENAPENQNTGLTLGNLGVVAKSLGDLEAADAYTRRALTIAEKQGPDALQVAGTLLNRGQIARMRGDYVAADRYLLQALAIDRKRAPSSELLATVLDNIGELALEEGDFRRAAESHKEALEIYRKVLPGSLEEGGELNALGEVATRQEDLEAAADYKRQALAIVEKVAPQGPETVDALLSSAKTAFARKQYADARKFCQKALEIQQSNPGNPLQMAKTFQGLGDLSAREQSWDEAGRYHAQALGLLEKTLGPNNPDVARALNAIAEIRARNGDSKEAFETAFRAESIGREHLRLTMQALSERQALLYASNRPAALDLLLSLVEQRLRSDPERVKQTWTAVLRSRSLVFDEMAGRHRAASSDSAPDVIDLAKQLASAKQRLANLTIRGTQDDGPDVYRGLLDRTRNEVEDLERNLGEKSQAFRQRAAQEQLGLPELNGALPRGSALVAYVRYSRVDLEHNEAEKAPVYGAFTMRAGDSAPVFTPLGSANTIEHLWSEWIKEIGKEAHSPLPSRSNEAAYRLAGRALRLAVWDPVALQLGKATDVFVVPDGALYALSLDSLPIGERRYLADGQPSFHYLSAERDLATKPSTHGRGMLALGNPDFNHAALKTTAALNDSAAGNVSSGITSPIFRGPRSVCNTFQTLRFAPLPGSGHEAEEVSTLWKRAAASNDGVDAEAIILTGSKADELEFREQSPGKRVLHLATHGFFLEGDCGPTSQVVKRTEELHVEPPAENPLLLSGLAFAGANHRDNPGHDGIVTAEEIATMNLDGVDLVVLSGCDTGRGQIRVGEGVFGLRRAFQLAGSKTVVMSLWPVEDELARNWMQGMYREWLVNGKTMAEATRLANREAIRQRRAKHQSTHPFYWAAFIATENGH